MARVRLCRGSDCRKRKKSFARLQAVIPQDAVGPDIKCQDVCKGPVVVVEVGRERYLFARMRGKRLRRDLLVLLQGGKPSKALKSALVKKKRLKKKAGE